MDDPQAEVLQVLETLELVKWVQTLMKLPVKDRFCAALSIPTDEEDAL